MELPHTKDTSEVLEHFKVSEDAGLSKERVKELRSKYGYNGELQGVKYFWLVFVCCSCVILSANATLMMDAHHKNFHQGHPAEHYYGSHAWQVLLPWNM